eukprot:4657001-Pleurochrysis_carterae.AAC.1
MSELGCDARRDQKRSEFLPVGAKRTHGESDTRCVMTATQINNVRQHPNGRMGRIKKERRLRLPTVRGVFENVFRSSIASCGKQSSGAAYDL